VRVCILPFSIGAVCVYEEVEDGRDQEEFANLISSCFKTRSVVKEVLRFLWQEIDGCVCVVSIFRRWPIRVEDTS
jgi:hypothetical protein